MALEELIEKLQEISKSEEPCEQCELVELKRETVKEVVDFMTAIVQMPKSGEVVTQMSYIDFEIYKRFKELIYGSNLPITLMKTLAIYEFIEKYGSTINKLKSISVLNK